MEVKSPVAEEGKSPEKAKTLEEKSPEGKTIVK